MSSKINKFQGAYAYIYVVAILLSTGIAFNDNK